MMVGVIDAHLHVVAAGSVRPDSQLAPSGPWWDRVDSSVDGVLSRVRAAGVDRAVVVQAVAAHGYDCSYLLSAAGPGIALVGAVDPLGSDPIAALDTLAERGVAGLRLFSIRPAKPWLDGSVGRALVARCVELGLRPSVCVLPVEIPALLALAEAFADVEFAVDHVAFAAEEPALLDAIANHDNLCPTVTPTCGLPLAEAIDRFGADRVSWGSDHPQHGAHYPGWPDPADPTAERPRAAGRLWFG